MQLNPGQHLTAGTKVTTSGYHGTIMREYSTRMYEVRLESGLVCVDVADIEPCEPMNGTEWTEPGQGATKRATRYGDEDIARRRGMHLVPKTRECYEQHTGNCWHAEVSK